MSDDLMSILVEDMLRTEDSLELDRDAYETANRGLNPPGLEEPSSNLSARAIQLWNAPSTRETDSVASTWDKVQGLSPLRAGSPSNLPYFQSVARPVGTDNFIEFTDLAMPLPQADLRRRRVSEQSEEPLSSMHLRRRAQNRASQRAFRERKEQHAEALQCQLNALKAKYDALEVAYDRLKSTNAELAAELDILRNAKAREDRFPSTELSDFLLSFSEPGTPERDAIRAESEVACFGDGFVQGVEDSMQDAGQV